MSRRSLWRFLAIALPALGALVAPMPSVDLTFLLRAGSEILGSGAVPTVDSWTFLADGRPWIDQQWGAEIVLQLVYAASGWTGLAIIRAALVGLAFGLLLATVRLRAPRLGAIGSALIVIAAFIVSADALALRAQLFAIVLFAATLLVLAARDRWPRLVWLIPVIALLWANLHGTFLFAAALCGLAWFADLYDARGRSGWQRHEMLLVGLVAAAITIVNPYGPAVWGYVANLTSNPTIASRVSEWRPPSILTVPGALVWVSVAGVVVLAARRVRGALAERPSAPAAPAPAWTRRGAFRAAYRLPWPGLLTLALFGGFALVSGRGLAWWPFAAVFVVGPWLQPAAGAATASTAVARPTPPPLRRLNAAIAAVIVLAGVALLPLWRPIGLAGVPNGTLSHAPQGIAAHLRPTDCVGPGPVVWNPQAWGSWLEFATPACNRFAVDSRIELFTPQDWAEIDAVEGAAPGFESILQRHGVVAVVTDHETDGVLEAALRASGRWAELYSDAEGTIWAMTDLPSG